MKELAKQLYGQMLLIRRFEEKVLGLFDEGILFGTTHCYIGQEANAAGLIRHLKPTDTIWSNHRCHGHYIAHTNDVDGLLAEIMGRKNGVVGGRGGSQHLCRPHFFSNGVQGGIAPVALGMAFAESQKKSDHIVTVFLGDGTMGEGVVYEAFNIASLWKLPILFVIEHNRYAQSTPTHVQLAGSLSARPEAFGIKTVELSTFNALEISKESEPIIDEVRTKREPRALVLNTYRLCHHSKSDDYRPVEEVNEWKKNDPLLILQPFVDKPTRDQLEKEVADRISEAEKAARLADFPALEPLDLDQQMVL
jgi:TPP-dependent pyruvate/acetoin dehydrogenase alpha subunit